MNKFRLPLAIASLCLGFFLLAACGQDGGGPDETATASLIPATATSSATPTQTPEPSSTPAATVTLVPTSTHTLPPSPTPTATPTRIPRWCRQNMTPAPTLPAAQGILTVTYIDNGNLWIWREGEDPRALTGSGDLNFQTLSEDGQRVAFLRGLDDRQIELWVVDADGQNERRLVSAARFTAMIRKPNVEAVHPFGLRWVPRTHTLAFNSFPVYADPIDFVADDLWLAYADTGELRQLLPHGEGGEFVYSPDGKQIALLTPDRMDLINSDGRNRRPNTIPGYHAVGMGEFLFYPQPAWAADSRSLKVGVPVAEDVRDPHPLIEIWEVTLLGFEAQKLTTLEGLPPSLVYSPDRSRVAYWRWPDLEGDNPVLHLAQVDGVNREDAPYWRGPQTDFLSWAPDSQKFTFWEARRDRILLGGICQEPAPLADYSSSTGMSRWVDSRQTLFVSGTDGAWVLRRVSIGQKSEPLVTLGDSSEFEFVLVPAATPTP